jgi:hypothetical protein
MDSSTSNSEPTFPFEVPKEGTILCSDPSKYQSPHLLGNVSILRVEYEAFQKTVPRYWTSVSAVRPQVFKESFQPRCLRSKFIFSLLQNGVTEDVLSKHVFTCTTILDGTEYGQGLLIVGFPVLPLLSTTSSDVSLTILFVPEESMKFLSNLDYVLWCLGVTTVNYFCPLIFI